MAETKKISTQGGSEVHCQGCGMQNLDPLLDLGYQPLCNNFMPITKAPSAHTFYPLCVYLCNECSLVQLGYVIPTTDTFGEQYTYLTGSSRSLVEYYVALANQLNDVYHFQPGDVVVEVGSNDGTFLKALEAFGLNVIGVEGSPQASALSISANIPTIDRFFGKGSAGEVKSRLPDGSKVKLVIAMNVLAHTDNINEFISEVKELMDEDTVFVSSCHWLIELIRKFEFDTIYHEHLRYYTMYSLQTVLERHGLFIFDAEVTAFYGGSIMSYSKIVPCSRSNRLSDIFQQEDQMDIRDSLILMKDTMIENKAKLLSMLIDIKKAGKRVIGVGAPMKASTLLNFYGITPDLIEYIAEVNELKVGTVVPGVRIPVVHEDRVFGDQPDYAILLSWNMAHHIIPNYRKLGYKGKFILPIPEPEVIND